MTKRGLWLATAFVALLAVVSVALMVALVVRLRRPPPAPFSTVQDLPRLLPDARRRDPFACGRALAIVVANHLESDAVDACCSPSPVPDLAGAVAKACAQLRP